MKLILGRGRLFVCVYFILFTAGYTSADIIYVKAATIFDGQQFFYNKTIIIKDGIIEDLTDDTIAIPKNADVINAQDQSVIPGFIESHIHFMAVPLPYVEKIEQKSWGKLAAEGLSLMPSHRLHLLQNGVTSIIDMGAPLGSYRAIIERMREKKLFGPDIYFPGPLITAPGGHPAGTIYRGMHDLIDEGTYQVVDETMARVKVQNLHTNGVSFIKIVYDEMSYRKKKVPRLDLAVAQAIIDEAHRLGLKVFAHAGTEDEAKVMIDAGIDGIEHAFVSTSDEILKEMSAKEVFFTPTLYLFHHYAPIVEPKIQETVKRAFAQKVPVTIGTDFPGSYGENPGDDMFKEMNALENLGISRIDVLTAATFSAARKIGKDREIGTIARGFRANLVFFDGSIEKGALSSDRIKKVMLDGNLVIENNVLHSEFAKYFRKKTLLVFPYGYWDPLYEFVWGASLTEFDLFNTGISVAADAAYSFRNMWSAGISMFLPSPITKTSLNSNLYYNNLNRLFYGIGNASKKDSSIEYSTVDLREEMNASTSLSRRIKFSSSLSLGQLRISAYNGQVLPGIDGRDGGNDLVMAFSLAYDSRDHANNPWHGLFLSGGAKISAPVFPDAKRFQEINLDLRGYLSAAHKHILAMRLLVRQSLNDVPFYYLPSFGGPTLGRGYPAGRFMDRAGVYGQTEYRFPIWKIISGTIFVEAGQVLNKLTNIETTDWHHSFGFGPRFSFGSNENTVLGIDVGFSSEGWTLFFHKGHAF